MPVTDAELRDAYIPYFQASSSSIQATIKAADQLSPEGGPARTEVVQRLVQIRGALEAEIGDPYRLAVRRALEKLEQEGVVEAMRETWGKAAAATVHQIPAHEWRPGAVVPLIRASDLGPHLALSVSEGGEIEDWKVLPEKELLRWMHEKSGFTQVAFPLEHDTGPEDLELHLNRGLHFIRTKSQRTVEKETGQRRLAHYDHEFVLSLLPKHGTFVTRWILSTEAGSFREHHAFQEIMKRTGVSRGGIGADSVWIQIQGRAALESLLNRLADIGLISRWLLGSDSVQAGTEFWDPKNGRWELVSSVVAEFDDFERWIRG